MDSKEFKILFDKIAKKNNFEKYFGGWFKETPECISVLDLQKSKYGNYYELNIKIFIQGLFGKTYVKNKDLVKKDIGDVFTRQPNEYKDILNLEHQMEDRKREKELEKLFTDFINPFVNKTSTKHGIKELAEKEKLFLLPAVKKELGINSDSGTVHHN